MSAPPRRPKTAKQVRRDARDPDWEPRFHDAELQRAYEATKPIFDRLRWEAAWREPVGKP